MENECEGVGGMQAGGRDRFRPNCEKKNVSGTVAGGVMSWCGAVRGGVTGATKEKSFAKNEESGRTDEWKETNG